MSIGSRGPCLYGVCPSWLLCQGLFKQLSGLLCLVMVLLQQVELGQAEQRERQLLVCLMGLPGAATCYVCYLASC